MSELKAYRIKGVTLGDTHDVYLKSEADKVIAELKKACKDKDDWCLYLIKELHHHKYKRCLAMVQVLEHVCPMTNCKAKWRDKWHKRWLELADEFKEDIK